jgi:hypothetical protein
VRDGIWCSFIETIQKSNCELWTAFWKTLLPVSWREVKVLLYSVVGYGRVADIARHCWASQPFHPVPVGLGLCTEWRREQFLSSTRTQIPVARCSDWSISADS